MATPAASKAEKEKAAGLRKEKELKEARDTLQLLRLVQMDNPFQATTPVEIHAAWTGIVGKLQTTADLVVVGADARKKVMKLLDAQEQGKNKARSAGGDAESSEFETLLRELAILRRDEREKAALLKKAREKKEGRENLAILREVQAKNPFQVSRSVGRSIDWLISWLIV